MHQTLRRLADSKLLWAATVFLLLYSVGGFVLAPPDDQGLSAVKP